MKQKFVWKKRYNLVVILFLTGILLAFDRAVISMALPLMEKDLNLSSVSLGLIMGSFSLAYALIQVPGGLLADKFGSRIIGTISIIFWSIFTVLTGVASSVAALVGVRFLFGLGEGSYVPAQYKALAVWFPKKERGRATAITNISMMVGGVLTAIVAAVLIGKFGWRNVFYSLFVPGLIIGFLYWVVVRDSPAKAKKLSAEELAEINADDVAVETAQKVKIADILKYPTVWQLYLVYFVSAMVSFGVNSWMSIYVVDVLKGTLMQFGIAGLFVALVGLVGQITGGIIADKSKATQKYQMFIGWTIAAVFLFLGVSTKSIPVAIVFFAAESCFFLLAVSAFFAKVATTLPRKAMGLGAGIIQTSGYIAGAISPVLIGYIVQLTGGNYKAAFILMCILLGIAGLLALTLRKTSFDEEHAAKPNSEIISATASGSGEPPSAPQG